MSSSVVAYDRFDTNTVLESSVPGAAFGMFWLAGGPEEDGVLAEEDGGSGALNPGI